MRHLVTVVMCLLGFHQLNAQSISIFGIDASSYPTMKAKFNAFDASWNQQMLSISELSLKENGVPRTITGVTCPVASPPAVVSIAMSFDVSSSMSETIELVKVTSSELCNLVAIPASEFALQTCDGYPLLLQDFTTDRNRILELIQPITATGDNNFTEHLLNRFAGLLTVAKNGRNKKVAIIFTDAWWPQLSQQELDQCIEFCRVFNIQFISVIYSKPETEPNGIKQSLQALASATGGYMYDGIFSKDVAKEIASRIQADAQGVMDNCEITWESDMICYNGQPGINVELGWNLAKGSSSYILPNDGRATLSVSPSYIAFGKVPPQKTVDTTITLTTQNVDFTVTGIRAKYGSPIFSVVGTSFPFIIPKNESKTITLRCSPVDSSMNYAAFEVITNICSGEFSAGSGFSGKKNKSPTLKLIKPNGGEQFLVGNDTLITWEGIAASDTVSLELSRNNGASWTKITDKASGLTYNWKKISKPTSNQCLVKVKLKANDNSPAIEWQKSFGGKGFDQANSIQQTFDGGYIIAGFSDSKDAAITNKGGKDFCILKLNISGTIDWQKTYGGSSDDIAQSIVQTGDGGYIVTGKSLSNFDNPTITKGNYDCWILKLNSKGDSIWQRTYGGNRDEEGLSIQQIDNGGYIVAGWSESADGWFVANKGNSDAWVLKLNSKGDMVSQMILGGSNYDFAQSIYQAKDKSFIVAGHTYSDDFDITLNKGQYDSWIIKIDSTANSVLWKETLGGSSNDFAQSIQQTDDGGYVFTGYTDSKNGDVKSNKGGYDYWVVKLDVTGDIEWQKTIGGSRGDKANSIQQTMDRGYIIAGESDSKDGDVSPNKNGKDYWIIKLDQAGEVEWQKSLGGSSADAATSIKQTSEGGYIIAGVSDSKDGDITANKGGSDFWIVKLSGDGEILQEDQSDTLFSIVTPQAQSRDIDMKQCLLRTKKDSLITDFVSNVGTYRIRIDSISFRGEDADAFSLASGIPPYFIEPTLSHSAEIRFKPTKVGIHNAETVIITQSDTLIQRIIGEGIVQSLEVINSVIDFGKVTVNSHKDTIDAVTVRNIGNAPLTITSTRHIGPNDTDFTTLAKGGNFTLQPHETAKLDLRFFPKSIGRTNGRLLFDFDGLGSPATVYLFGEGIKSEAQIKASGFTVPSFACETQMIDSVLIQNIGADTLFVQSAVFGGMNPGDFQFVTPFSPVKIAKDSIVLLPVRFSPASVGTRSAFVEIHSNSSTDSVLTLTLSGTKDDASFTSNVQTINIGVLCPDEGKDTSILLFNTGTLKNTFRLQSNVCTFSSSSIEIGISDNKSVSIYYTGQTNEGVIDETITITDSICGVQKVVRLTGIIKRTKIISQLLADFGNVYDGSSSTLEVFAVNKDIRPIVIESPTGINLPFKLDSLFPPAGSVLAPDDTVKARIRYDAAAGAPGIGYLNWSVILPCPSMDSTELRAHSLRADTVRTAVFVQDITAQAGEKVNLVLKLHKQTGMQLAGAPTEWRARIRYNKSILFNTQTNNACLPSTDDNCIIELNDKYNPQSSFLASIPCVATLGNTDNSALTIEDFQWTDGNIVVEEPQKLNGAIRITGICEQGGVRLFIPAKSSTSLSTRPNPAQNSIQIQYGLREPLTVTLELLDITGQVVQTIVSNQQQPAGQYTLMNDMSLLGNGVYSLRLTTNKEVLISRVDVVK